MTAIIFQLDFRTSSIQLEYGARGKSNFWDKVLTKEWIAI